MLSVADKSRVLDHMEALFEDFTIEDVVDLLAMQMANAIAQGSRSADEADAFLNEVRRVIAEYLRAVDFDTKGITETDVSEPTQS